MCCVGVVFVLELRSQNDHIAVCIDWVLGVYCVDWSMYAHLTGQMGFGCLIIMFKEVSQRTNQKTSILHYSRDCSNLTLVLVTRFKDAVNLADPTCCFQDTLYPKELVPSFYCDSKLVKISLLHSEYFSMFLVSNKCKTLIPTLRIEQSIPYPPNTKYFVVAAVLVAALYMYHSTISISW